VLEELHRVELENQAPDINQTGVGFTNSYSAKNFKLFFVSQPYTLSSQFQGQ